MTRGMKPTNRALQDRISEVLADAIPEALTSAQVAERVGGTRTLWEECRAGRVDRWHDDKGELHEHLWECRADPDRKWFRTFEAQHHAGGSGQVDQDSWEIPYDAMDMNPPLNRLARDGLVAKVKLPELRTVLWRWLGPVKAEAVAELEDLWARS